MKWLAAGFAIFIVVVIILADLGRLVWPLGFLNSIPMGDKLGHFLLMGLLSFLVLSSLYDRFPARKPGLIALTGGILIGLVISMEEASQVLIAGRDADILDLAADYAGIAFFSWLSLRLHRKHQGSQPG